MRVLSRFIMVTRSVHGKKLDVTKSYHLNYLRFKLIKVENAKSIANPHEQGGSNKFSRFGKLGTNFGKFIVIFWSYGNKL
jgi:hypothetical protein